MEEFQEADVLWQEESHRGKLSESDSGSRCPKRSSPINISPPPASQSWKLDFSYRETDNGTLGGGFNDDGDTGGMREMMPPHVILSRRYNGEMAFSLCTGNGRTLKGRDLSQVRNSVLRLTGFLEG